ncbi:MAG: DUF2318 domain-containing protein [Thermincola sp.]|nr:DUF2318 domain-containing protein [Thermincola sp.]MDT3704958.1 DUF2318 domain-containing protein [Thermincola sp.]
MSRNDKRSKFTETQQSSSKIFVIAGVVVVLVLAFGGFMLSKKPSTVNPNAVNVGAVSYQKADFKAVTATETGGDIVLDMNQLQTDKTVTFKIQGINFSLANGTPFNYLPLLAYVSPKGNIVVATSLCEPCSGTTFHVEGDHLVCNSCGTRWSLESLQGISGGCTTYPPETVNYTVEGDKLIIKKADLENWQPRQV